MKKIYKLFFVGMISFSFYLNLHDLLAQENKCLQLVWSDEFDYTGLPDPAKWSFEEMKPGTVNNELQYYPVNRQENARVENGNLIIEARKDNYKNYEISSARLRTIKKGDWLYGRVEVKAKLPSGKGTWPAIWMLATDGTYGGWPNSGEIDIMEHVGYEMGVVHGSTHCNAYVFTKNNQKTATIKVSNVEKEFHIYTMDWYPDRIEMFVDGKKYFTSYNEGTGWEVWPFDKRFYLILNLAFGGDWGGAQGVDKSSLPQSMVVDYVRVYQGADFAGIIGKKAVVDSEKGLNYSVPVVEGAKYTWSVPEGSTIISGQGTNSISVDWGCKEGNVSIDIETTCGKKTSAFPVSFQAFEIKGSEWVPENSKGVIYSVPNNAGSKYTWNVGDNEIATGLNTSQVSINFVKEGQISLDIQNSCGTLNLVKTVKFGDGQFPYPNPAKPNPIPGLIIAGNFDSGGQEVAYNDKDPLVNQGNAYRNNEGVDIEANDNSRTIGWFEAGEWVEYTVDIAETGKYDMDIRIASPSGGGLLKIMINNVEITDQVKVPSSGAWNKFMTVQTKNVELVKGKAILKVEVVKSGFNMGNIRFKKASTGIENQDRGELFEIFPNPTKGTMNIYFKKSFNKKLIVSILTLQGKVLRKEEISGNKTDYSKLFDIQGISKGLYLVNIKSGNEIYYNKVIFN